MTEVPRLARIVQGGPGPDKFSAWPQSTQHRFHLAVSLTASTACMDSTDSNPALQRKLYAETSIRAGILFSVHGKLLAQINPSYLRIPPQFSRRARPEDPALIDDISAIGH